MKKPKSKAKHCGNCHHHSAYRYPDKVFCVYRFLKKEDPVVSTLDVCENWKLDHHKCFCVQEASKNV
ncbi:MAG: hypothetical protein ACLFU9_00350 [Candidatus Bathyarchaeia archaeon]